ncbi:MAG: L,D-transpeptidase [Actinomycetota bacterium]|nr:L,D-transpeptidase [Actinomycetota bacterium]
MNRPGRTPLTLLAFAATLVVALPAGSAHAAPPAAPAATGVTLEVKGAKTVPLLRKVVAEGQLANPAGNDNVFVTVSASGRQLFSQKITPKPNGSFEFPITVDACCRYVVTAENGEKKASDSFSVLVPKKLGKGPVTKLYNKSLQDAGFHTGTKGRSVTIGTRLATKAFRKTNGMARSEAYRPSIFRELLEGKGAFEPRYNDGRHVEVDISRQVMSLIEGDTPVHTFHVSTGTGATPTIRGKFHFYMRQAGYNAKRMYYSVYFRGGYATHGYNPVPNYNASHGCVRNPIPFSRFIYNWVAIGMPIYVYD